MPPGKR